MSQRDAVTHEHEAEAKRLRDAGGTAEPPAKARKFNPPACWNKNLANIDVDYLYHLGLTSADDLAGMFGDTKLVCMHGSPNRAQVFAVKLAGLSGRPADSVKPIGKTERCLLFKVGPVVSISHGMGMPSMLIFLHEIAKLLSHAGCDFKAVEFLRIGTSGGVGVDPGTVVIADRAVDACLEPGMEHVELGVKKRWPTASDAALVGKLSAAAAAERIPSQRAVTMGTDDFYEGQGRLDGALMPWYTEADKIAFLRKAHGIGVRNIEMEAPAFLYFWGRLGAPAAVLCATLLDRLAGDQVTSTPAQLGEFSDRAQGVVINYAKARYPALLPPLGAKEDE